MTSPRGKPQGALRPNIILPNVIDIAIEPEPLDPDGDTDFDSQHAAQRGIQI